MDALDKKQWADYWKDVERIERLFIQRTLEQHGPEGWKHLNGKNPVVKKFINEKKASK